MFLLSLRSSRPSLLASPHLLGRWVVPRCDGTTAIDVSGEATEGSVEKGWPVELGKIGHHDLPRVVQGLLEGTERNLGRLLDLVDVALSGGAGE